MKFNVAVIIRCLYNSEFTSYLQLLAGYQQSPYNVSLISYSQNEGEKNIFLSSRPTIKIGPYIKRPKGTKQCFFYALASFRTPHKELCLKRNTADPKYCTDDSQRPFRRTPSFLTCQIFLPCCFLTCK